MRGLFVAGLLAVLFSAGVASAADVPAYIGRRVSTPEDTQAISKVIDDFQVAIRTKDVKLLTSLVVGENLLWASPPPPQVIREMKGKLGPDFNGLREGAFRDFARFIGSSKVPVEEKFYNVQITQDANLAWVMFDYEFVQDGRTTNHGVETWQMMKSADGEWKIVSVVWTMHRPD
jgi:ketosteroid isomerase-like protein